MIENIKKNVEKSKLSDKFQQPFVDTRSANVYGAAIAAFNSKKQKKFKKSR